MWHDLRSNMSFTFAAAWDRTNQFNSASETLRGEPIHHLHITVHMARSRNQILLNNEMKRAA